jgi:hypothetical protein
LCLLGCFTSQNVRKLLWELKKAKDEDALATATAAAQATAPAAAAQAAARTAADQAIARAAAAKLLAPAAAAAQQPAAQSAASQPAAALATAALQDLPVAPYAAPVVAAAAADAPILTSTAAVATPAGSTAAAAAPTAAVEQPAAWAVLGTHCSHSAGATLVLRQVTAAGTWLHTSKPTADDVTITAGGRTLRAVLKQLPLRKITVNPVRAFETALGWAHEMQERRLLPEACAGLQRALRSLQQSPLTDAQRVRLACQIYAATPDAAAYRPVLQQTQQVRPNTEKLSAVITLHRASGLDLPLSAWTTLLPAAEVEAHTVLDCSSSSDRSSTSSSDGADGKAKRQRQQRPGHQRTVVWCYCVTAAQLPDPPAVPSPWQLAVDLKEGFNLLCSLCLSRNDNFCSLVQPASGLLRNPLPRTFLPPALPFYFPDQVQWRIAVQQWVGEVAQLGKVPRDSAVVSRARAVLHWTGDDSGSAVDAVMWAGPLRSIVYYLSKQCEKSGPGVLDTATADGLVR